MEQSKIKNVVLDCLKEVRKIWDDKEELNQVLLLDLLERYDEEILTHLFSNEQIRKKFFIDIKGNYIFKLNDFRFFIEENKIFNSYTQYKNRIGLTDGKRFLKESTDVVLDFPFKDCVLEGGQTTEEGKDTYFEYSTDDESYVKKESKRKEIFFNQVLAQDEIDRLFDDKAFKNWKRYTKDGEQEVNDIRRDENGIIKENLIIKGNNLLALHCLEKQFSNKINLIYIDPPFNTGNDSFLYNDKFSRSTWLTFMKNRLEIAKKLLSSDGNIFIHIDNNHNHYLKVLCDNVFGEINFVEEIIWAYGSPSGGRAAGAKPVNIHDYILHYCKNYSQRKQKKTFTPYPEKYIKDWFKYKDDDGRIYRRRMRGKDENGKSLWSKQYLDESKGLPLSTVWNDIKQVYADPRAYKDNQQKYTELEKRFTGGQKPEALIKRIIEMCTDEYDYVLDFHLGTGTTAVSSHKMNRYYIGIEQMDYINDFSIKRIKGAINGDKKGISDSVNWQGGGDFIYLELAKWNEQAKEEILACNSLSELENLFEELYLKYFLNYNVKINEFKEKIIKEEEFKNLSLDMQKQMFCEMLDLNQMYVQKSEMKDKKFGIDAESQRLTTEFYDGK